MSSAQPAAQAIENSVHLTGRLAAVPTRVRLPSGDEVVGFRVVVDRPPRHRRGSSVAVDTIECSVWGAALGRRVEQWQPGDVVTVRGAPRRRFWRTSAGPRSRYEVEVSRARRRR